MNFLEEIRDKFQGTSDKLEILALAIIDRLDRISESVERGSTQRHRYSLSKQGVSDAAGLVEISLYLPQMGSAWFINDIIVTGADAGQFDLYLGSVDNSNLLDTVASPRRNARHAQEIYVPDGANLIARWITQGVGQACTIRLGIETVTELPEIATDTAFGGGS